MNGSMMVPAVPLLLMFVVRLEKKLLELTLLKGLVKFEALE
jgi:hypothetical protein